MGFAFAIVLVVGFTAFVVLESLRQQRKIGRATGRPNLIGLGALELERHLTPDPVQNLVVRPVAREDVDRVGGRLVLPRDVRRIARGGGAHHLERARELGPDALHERLRDAARVRVHDQDSAAHRLNAEASRTRVPRRR